MMLMTVLNVLTGGLLDKILGFFQERNRARIAAMTTEQKQAHERKLAERQQRHEQRLAERNARVDIRKATAGFWEMRLMTFLIAFPFASHLWSVWLDTQFKFGWGVDKFPTPFNDWEGAILLSFFGISGLGMVANAIFSGRK